MGRRVNNTRLWLAACVCVAAAATHCVAARPSGSAAGSARSLLQGGQCGAAAGGASCTGGQCCSQYGWCGNTDAHCGAGCQSAYGSCSGGGSSGGGGQGGQCGLSAGGASCTGGQCCSQYGWCGNTDAHCGAGCQSAYGSCSSGGSSGGSGGGSGSTYSGDITWYNDVGTTACGENVPGDGNYAAISWPLSDQLNTNANWPPSWCGRNAKVTGPTGLTAIVRVIDKCQACKYGDIDVTPSIFNQVVPGGTAVGRTSVTWQFV